MLRSSLGDAELFFASFPSTSYWATFTESLRDKSPHRTILALELTRMSAAAGPLPNETAPGTIRSLRAKSPLKLGSLRCNISIVGIFLSGLQQAAAFLLVASVGVLT